ncbi:unnamed protein product [Gadus morhua 'NCC']
MDSRDGHRELPGCLGMAHLRGDVKNPSPAALDLPLEERGRRAGLQAALVSLTDSSSTHGGQFYGPEGKSSGRKHSSSHKPPHKHKWRRTADAGDSPRAPSKFARAGFCRGGESKGILMPFRFMLKAPSWGLGKTRGTLRVGAVGLPL